MNKLQKRKGFTLTELAVVIAVIAVLIAVLVPTFYSLLNKAQVSTDSQLTKTMNEAISIEEATSGIETPEDAITAALSVGYSVENLSAKSEGNVIVYDQESKNFVLINEGLTTVVYKSSSTTKTDYKTATTWLFLETTDSSIVTSTGTNEYTIDGDNSYILIGSGWAGATITVKSASGIDTSQVTGTNASYTKVITTYVTASQTSGSTNPVAAKSAVATSGSTSDYPILYNVKGAYLNYNGGEVAVKIFGSSYVSFSDDVKNNSNSIVVANTVSYVDVTAASGTIKVDVESGGATQIISDGQVTVTNTSGTQLSVTLVSSSYGSTTEEAKDVEELVTESSKGVYKVESSETKDPTCEESGYTTYVYVNNYTGDKITVIKDIEPANGHSYTIAWNWSDDHSTASVTYTCSECDENTANHTYTKDATVTSQTTEATCTATGKTVYTATVTFEGQTYTDTKEVTINATGHTNAEAVTENYVAATCTEDGSYDSVVYCSVCGAEISRTTITISATGHTASEAVIENEVAATCTTDGSYDSVVYCSVCGEELSRETITIPATGHSYTSEVTKEATCTEDGVKTYTCSSCGDTYTETISATGHTETTTTSSTDVAPAIQSNEIVAALTTTTTTTCNECSTVTITTTDTEYKKISELSSELKEELYDDGNEYSVGDWLIDISEDCTIINLDKYSGNDTIVVIPTNITNIAYKAFKDNTSITSITIPNSVISIEKEAFYGCTSLTSITIPGSVTTINDEAFNGCTKLATLSLSDGLSTIGKNAFAYCTALTNVVVPDSVKTIGLGAFYGCSGITTMTLPFVGGNADATEGSDVTLFGYIFGTYDSGIDRIDNMHYSTQEYNNNGTIVYSNIPNLSTVTITGNTIYPYAFAQMHSISTISIVNVTEIPDYAFFNCSDNYVLVQGDTSKSIYYTGLTSVKLSENITSIGTYAFSSCEISTISLGSSLKTIGISAFTECQKLTSITIPASVTEIGDRAFFNCTGLENIFYNAANATVSATTGTYTSNANEIFDYAGKSGSGITVTIGTTVEVIPAYLFYPNTAEKFDGTSGLEYTPNITSVVFKQNNSLTEIGSYAFYGLSSLTSITGMNYLGNVTTIGASVFSHTGLTSVNTGALTLIGDSMFRSCSSLTTVTLASSLTKVYDNAFTYCYALTTVYYNSSNLESAITTSLLATNGLTVYIGEDVTSIGYKAFFGAGSRLTSVVFSGNNVTSIGSLAFCGCTGLTSITLPSSLTEIGTYAFDGCTGLTDITLPDGLTTLGNGAFNGCTGLSSVTSITLPSSLKTIGDNVFSSFTGLETVYVSSSVAWNSISIGSNNDPLTSATIVYTAGSKDVSLDTSTKTYSCTESGIITITLTAPASSVGDATFQLIEGTNTITSGTVIVNNCTYTNIKYIYVHGSTLMLKDSSNATTKINTSDITGSIIYSVAIEEGKTYKLSNDYAPEEDDSGEEYVYFTVESIVVTTEDS